MILLDQRRLPGEVVHHTYTDYRELAQAIKDMVIRGAPAIGVAAAMGIALGVERSKAKTLDELRAEFATICDTLARTRPTAVDLFWAIDRFKKRFDVLALAATNDGEAGLARIRVSLVEEAQNLHQERREADERIGRFGAELLPKSGRVMTQCNAGALATGGIGTALGVIRMAVEGGYRIEVLVPETRPYLQGARLTAWELHQDHIPLTLITDNMVGHFLKTGGVRPSWSAPTALRAMATRRTKSARTELRFSRGKTKCRFMWPRRFRRSIFRLLQEIRFPLKNARKKKSRISPACASRPTFTRHIPPSTSRPRGSSPPSSPSEV